MSGVGSSVRDSLAAQAASCRSIGSPLYGTLLDGLTVDYDRGGVTAALLDGVTDQPVHDALPLRYLASAHRLALAGRADELARHYPSCGGSWDGGDAVVGDFLAVAEHEQDALHDGVRRNVQTNEVGRAAVLASGMACIARRHGMPIDQLEIGSSAGLLSRWDQFGYDTGASQMGDPGAPVQFGREWWRGTPPDLGSRPVVARRRASDIQPIDIGSVDGRLTAMSFVWPDQSARFDRLAAAIEVARHHPLSIDAADAGTWLGRELAAAPSAEVATVVFHSIVWQYLPAATRAGVRDALGAAGGRAHRRAPVLWLRMEPAGSHADLRFTTWPGGREEVLAHVGYHGAEIRWLAAN